jgi:DNA (cytosine-5)-methyltransferase 1
MVERVAKASLQSEVRLEEPSLKYSLKQPTAMDLFAGCGGMSIGLEKAGFKVIHANEINKDAASTYRRNFPNVEMMNVDIRKINVRDLRRKLGYPEVDVIAAGPPCQGFSTAGKRNPRDSRNLMYKEVLRFVREFNPKIVVVENVVGMLLTAKGIVIKRIMSEFASIGYYPYKRVLVASDFGVPQCRKRVFVIASTAKIDAQKLFPNAIGGKVSVFDAISDLAFLDVNENSESYQSLPSSDYQTLMRKNESSLFNHKSPDHSSRIQKRFELIPHGRNGRDFLPWTETSKRTYFKLHPNRVSMTLTTLPEDFIHYSKNRILTVREMARLQSFPDNFEFLGPRTTGGPRRKFECPQYTQVANAVPPLLAEAVFTNLAQILEQMGSFEVMS